MSTLDDNICFVISKLYTECKSNCTLVWTGTELLTVGKALVTLSFRKIERSFCSLEKIYDLPKIGKRENIKNIRKDMFALIRFNQWMYLYWRFSNREYLLVAVINTNVPSFVSFTTLTTTKSLSVDLNIQRKLNFDKFIDYLISFDMLPYTKINYLTKKHEQKNMLDISSIIAMMAVNL